MDIVTPIGASIIGFGVATCICTVIAVVLAKKIAEAEANINQAPTQQAVELP